MGFGAAIVLCHEQNSSLEDAREVVSQVCSGCLAGILHGDGGLRSVHQEADEDLVL